MKLFKKITAVTLSLVMCLSMAAFTVSADTASQSEPTVTETVLLTEDFSGYNSVHLLNNGTSGNSWKGAQTNKWLVNVWDRCDKTGSTGSSALLNEDIMTVTYNNLGGSVRYNNPIVTRKVDETSSTVGESVTLPTEGSLVVSAKVKVDANATSADFSSNFRLLSVVGDDAITTGSVTTDSWSGIANNNALYHSLKLDASGNIIPANFTADGFSFARDKWHTITFTYDLTQTTAQYACDITVATEGVAESVVFENVALTGSTAGKLDAIYGISVGLGINDATAATLGNGTVYYDDFGVKTVKIEYPEEPEPTVPMATLLNEDFSSYTDGELLNSTGSLSSNSWSTWASTKQNTWLISVYSRGDKSGSRGSSAKLDSGMMTVNYNNLGTGVAYYNPFVTRKVDTSENAVGSAMTLPTDGKLVASAKVKVDANTTSADFSSNFILLGIAGDDALEAGSAGTGIIGNTKLYHSLKLDASGNIIPANFTADGFSFARDKWHTITFTYDLTQTTAQYACDITVATEGVAESVVFENVALTGSTAGKLDAIYGISVGLGINNATAATLGNGTVYYDDFKVECTETIMTDASGAFVENTGFVADISVTAVANSAKDVWCVVAAYGENNKLIDAKIADFGSVAANTPVSMEDITLANATAENTRRVCVLVWDGSDTMVPYMQPITIYPAQ